MSKQKVGVIGLGSMGIGVARSLLAKGFEVHACDVRAEAVANFAKEGGVAAASPTALGAAVPIAIVLVVNADQTEQVLFGANGAVTIPDNPRGSRSKSIENRCKGKGEWNVYDVVCVDGVIKLAVNGKFVNGISGSSVRKGYLCLESEGAEIHFRNIRILELPPGVITPEQTAPVVEP